MSFRTNFCKVLVCLRASYHEHDLPQVPHGPEIHEVILITAVRDYDLGAHPTCRPSDHEQMQALEWILSLDTTEEQYSSCTLHSPSLLTT